MATVQFIDEETLVSTGGRDNEVVVWKIGAEDDELLFRDGVGRSNYSAALNGAELAFSKIPDKAYGDAPYREVFNLFDRKNDSINSTNTRFKYPQRTRENWGLFDYDPVMEDEWSPSQIMCITKNKQVIDSVVKYPDDGNKFGAFTFVDDEYLVTGCSYGVLEAWDYNTQLQSTFVGHFGAIRSVSISENGKFLISSGLDMTIRFWPINEIGLGKESPTLPSAWDYCTELEVGETFHKVFNKLGVENFAKSNTREAWETVISRMKLEDWPCDFLQNKLGNETANTIYPTVSIFLADNGEWVIWNRDGYFTSSKKGAKYVGYHVNAGRDQEAHYYPFDQFDLKYNRPDIIMKEMEMADAGILELYRKAYLKRLKRMGMTEDDLKADVHAPNLQIKKYTTDGSIAHITIAAEDYKYGLNRLNVYVNDVPIYGRDGIDLSSHSERFIDRDLNVDLMNGSNKVQVSVLNKNGVESLRETVYINSEGSDLPEMYVACIGVSDYQDKAFTLNYAAKDAIDIASVLKSSDAFSEVHTEILTDNLVTRDNILQLKEFFAQAGPNDVVTLFIAGHGVLDSELDYFYGTYDMDFQNPKKGGISYTELETLFDGIKAIRKLLIMDTCHSGELDKDDVEEVTIVEFENEDIAFRTSDATNTVRTRQGLKKTNEAVKEMFNDLNRGTGTTVISSAGGVEFAMESEAWKNGLFTYCFLTGIKSKAADKNGDGQIYISELQEYIQREVSILSKGKQLPSSRFENISLDYPMW